MANPTPKRAGAPVDPAIWAALTAYGLWGLLPAFLSLLSHLPALEVTGQRILWSVPCALVAARLFGGWASLKVGPRVLRGLGLSALLIGANWVLYVWAVGQSRILEASLGYFINPLINVALGVFLFSERLNRLQMAAIALATAGVLNQTFAVGAFPWVAFGLAGTFAAYGLVRKTVPVTAPAGLFWETAILALPAAATLIVLAVLGTPPMAGGEPKTMALLALTGPVTAVPLILFAVGARGLPFATLGLLQYLAPTLQFATGIALGEPFTPAHAVTFALIWSGLALYSLAALRAARKAAAEWKTTPDLKEGRGQ
jgi:chloramphenicol-sensitive protein RarD